VSKIGESSGNLNQPRVVPIDEENGPVWDFSHCAKSPWNSPVFRLMSSLVRLELTENTFKSKTWSCRFLPTSGRSTIVWMLDWLSRALSPIPDNMSNWGVLSAPAASITSFVARREKIGPGGVMSNKV
jgi:hypothetical protein